MLEDSWKLPGPFGGTSFFHEIFIFLECMPGPVSAKYSAQRNVLEAFPIPLDRFWSQEGSDKFSANSVAWAARFSQLKGAKRTNTCMRAVNRQPMFTARRTRRAFSVSVHAFCSITRMCYSNTDCWTTTIERLNNQKSGIKHGKMSKFLIFSSQRQATKKASCTL